MIREDIAEGIRNCDFPKTETALTTALCPASPSCGLVQLPLCCSKYSPLPDIHDMFEARLIDNDSFKPVRR